MSDLAPWLKDAPINRDRDLRLQYLAGWGINSQLADEIYRQILSYRHLPASLFGGSAEQLEALAQPISKSGYGKYLLALLSEPYFASKTEKL